MRQLVLKHPKLLRLVYVVIALLGSSKLIANSGVLSVTVVDENETPLSGVNVFTNDLDFTAVTDGEGKVKIQSMGSLQEVNFSYIGYKTIKKSFFHLLYIERKIKMLPELEVIPPIVVVGRRDDKPTDIPFSVEKISQEEIAFVQAQNAADALQYNGNVFVQKSQMGGGSPIIRGFEANRLLLVVDGVRMNNAIYRNGHLQNAITVDHSILEQAEIIYGPGSLHYGSDALGGVIHYRTKDPKLNRGLSGSTISGHYGARYASANSEQSGHLDFNIGSNKWATLTSLNYSNFGDLRAGANRPAAYPDFGKNFFSVERIDGQDVLKANPDPNVQRN
ncbi:MAG: TonB-dependent receptor plug domain-containing protein, partial [Bacteroidota bacterium]